MVEGSTATKVVVWYTAFMQQPGPASRYSESFYKTGVLAFKIKYLEGREAGTCLQI